MNPAAQVFVVVIISVRLLALSGIPVGRVGVGVAVVGCIAEQVSSVWLHSPVGGQWVGLSFEQLHVELL